jgi:hypothetical protein
MKASCSVPAGQGRAVSFRPDRDGSFRLAIVMDAGTCMVASLDAAAAQALAETIAQALRTDLLVFTLPE